MMAGKMAYLSQEEKQKIRNALKIKKSLDKEEDHHNLRDSSPESGEVDFKKVIHPLSYYIHDREQMIEEMFSIIKGDNLRKMLPPLLKNYTLEEIKADCLVHLLGMSKKRILAIIEGRELYSSSDSESESSSTGSEPDEASKSPTNKFESKSNIDDDDLLDISISEKDIDSLMKDKPAAASKSKKPKTRIKKKIKIEKDVSLFSIVISDDDLDDKSSKKPKKLNRERASNKLDKILGSKEKGKKRRKGGNTNKGNDDNQKLDENNAASLDENDKGKTLLEILELEMRARAIRALLKNTNDVEEESSVLSDAVRSTTEAATKSDPKIVDAIAEAINQSLAEKNPAELNDDSDPDDVEIIDDVDLCVLIDDDDDIGMETSSEVPAPSANEKCDLPANVSEKEKPVAADTPAKNPTDDAEKSNKHASNKSKPLQACSEKSKPSTDDSSKNKPLQACSEKRKPSADDSDRSKPPNNNLEMSKSPTNDSEKSAPAKDDLEKGKPGTGNSEKKRLSSDHLETSESLHDDSKKRKLSKDDSEKIISLIDDSEMSEPAEEKCPETLKSSIKPTAEKAICSAEKSPEKCEPPKKSDVDTDSEKCDLTKDDSPADGEESTNPTDNVTWSERWAEKQNVKAVVKNSKICANIRKRMRFARLLKQKQSEASKPKEDEIDIGNVEESSVAHYNLIKAHTSKSIDDTNDGSKAADEQNDPVAETSHEVPSNNTDADITTADHTLTILESDPKTLIIDISDDEVIPDSPSCDNS